MKNKWKPEKLLPSFIDSILLFLFFWPFKAPCNQKKIVGSFLARTTTWLRIINLSTTAISPLIYVPSINFLIYQFFQMSLFCFVFFLCGILRNYCHFKCYTYNFLFTIWNIMYLTWVKAIAIWVQFGGCKWEIVIIQGGLCNCFFFLDNRFV